MVEDMLSLIMSSRRIIQWSMRVEMLSPHCQLLEDVSLNLDLLVGQSYDSAGNMRGKQSGLQATVQQLSP